VELKQYNFQLLYRKGASNAKADILSRCPAFTSREGGTTSATNQTMLDKSQWLEVGTMELDLSDIYESIQISAIEVDQLLSEARETITEEVMLDKKYKEICKQVSTGGNIDTSATTLVTVRNTRVFRTALMALTEPHAL